MKKAFVLKKIGDTEYRVIKKVKENIMASNGYYEIFSTDEDYLTEDEIREYFIKEKGINYTTDELKKLSTYQFEAGKGEKLFGDLIIINYSKNFKIIGQKNVSKYFRNAKAVIWDMKKEKEIQFGK